MSTFSDVLMRLKNEIVTKATLIEGTFTMSNLRAVAKEFALFYNRLKILQDNYSLDTATGEYLDTIGSNDDGLDRHYAVFTWGDVTFTGLDGAVIPSGAIVSAPEYGVRYTVVGSVTIANGTATATVEALTVGTVGNVPAHSVTVIEKQITGVTGVDNAEAFDGGVDRESDDDYRERIKEKRRNPATSGNVYHYKLWAKEVNGVSAVKVFPLWKGLKTGTVKVSILGPDKKPASPELVQNAQQHIDPTNGKGGGQAPIGAIVTVATATEKPVNISAKVEVGAAGGNIEQVKAAFKKELEAYFASIAYDEKTDGVSVARIGYVLLNVEGVIDYAQLSVNGGTTAITIDEEEVLTVGTIDFTPAPVAA